MSPSDDHSRDRRKDARPIPVDEVAPDGRRRCLWCSAALSTGEGVGLKGIPAVCDACSDVLASPRRQRIDHFLEDLPRPVLVMGPHAVVVAANRKARVFLGKAAAQIEGRRGGDVIECVNASLPGGCGRTTHCKACALRRSVEHTFTTGEPLAEVDAYQSVVTASGIRRLWFRLATERVGEVVLVRIDDVGPERGE